MLYRGHIPLHLSVGLSPSARKNLLDRTGSTYLLIGPGADDQSSQITGLGEYRRLEWATVDDASNMDVAVDPSR
jgi:hypothetical protein